MACNDYVIYTTTLHDVMAWDIWDEKYRKRCHLIASTKWKTVMEGDSAKMRRFKLGHQNVYSFTNDSNI